MGRAMPRDRVLAGAPPVSRWRGGEARQGKYPGRGPGDTRLRHRLPAPRRSRSPPREPGFGRPRRVDWRAAPPPSACSRRGARREDLVARRFRLVAFRPGEGCPLRRHNAPIAAAAPGRAAAATRGAGRRPKPRPRGPAAPVPACLGADVPRRRALRAGAPPPAHGPGSRPRPLPGGRVTAAAPSAAPAALPVAPPLAALGSAGGGARLRSGRTRRSARRCSRFRSAPCHSGTAARWANGRGQQTPDAPSRRRPPCMRTGGATGTPRNASQGISRAGRSRSSPPGPRRGR